MATKGENGCQVFPVPPTPGVRKTGAILPREMTREALFLFIRRQVLYKNPTAKSDEHKEGYDMANISAYGKYLKIILLCLFVAASFHGAASASEKKVLNLDQLIEMALQTSPELKMAEQDVLAARGEFKQAKGGQWPQFDFIGMTGPVNQARVPTADYPSGHLTTHEGDALTIFGRLDFVIAQPLYTFGKITNLKEAAALGVEARMAAKDSKRNEVVLHVRELYYAYLVAAQGKNTAQETDDFIQDAGKRIKRLIELKAQNADQSDIYRLEAFSGEVKSFQAKAESGSHLAYTALKKAVGLPDNVDFQLDRTELPKDTAQLASEEEYVAEALGRRPELTQVKKGAIAKEKVAEAAKADFYPSIFAAVIGSVAGSPDRESIDSTYIPDDFNHAYAGIVAGAEWHLDFGITKGRLDKARAEHQKLLHAQEFAERNIPLEVIKYYQDAVEARKAYTAYREAAIGSRRWIIAAFSNFDVGVGTAKDMFDAIDRYGKNQGEYLRALYAYHVSLARLQYAIGKSSETPVQAN